MVNLFLEAVRMVCEYRIGEAFFKVIFVADDAAFLKARKEEVTESSRKTVVKTMLANPCV